MATLDEILNLDSMSQISNSKKSGAVARRVCVCVGGGGGNIPSSVSLQHNSFHGPIPRQQ